MATVGAGGKRVPCLPASGCAGGDLPAEKAAPLADVTVVAVVGPSCSGKTTVADGVRARLAGGGRRSVCVVHQDDFFVDDGMAPRTTLADGAACIDWDCPEALRWEPLVARVRECSRGSCGCPGSETAGDGDGHLVIVEGTLLFTCVAMRACVHEWFVLDDAEENCRRRREQRTYDGDPDPPGYFCGVAWPNYQRHLRSWLSAGTPEASSVTRCPVEAGNVRAAITRCADLCCPKPTVAGVTDRHSGYRVELILPGSDPAALAARVGAHVVQCDDRRIADIHALLLGFGHHFEEFFWWDYRQRLRGPGVIAAIATEGGPRGADSDEHGGPGPVAHACLMFDPASPCPVSNLGHVFTDPRHRRRGLSGRCLGLLLRAHDLLLPDSPCILGTGSPHAADMYEALGFRPLAGGLGGDVKGYNPGDAGELLMVRAAGGGARGRFTASDHFKLGADVAASQYACEPLQACHCPGVTLLLNAFPAEPGPGKLPLLGVRVGVEAEECLIKALAGAGEGPLVVVVAVERSTRRADAILCSRDGQEGFYCCPGRSSPLLALLREALGEQGDRVPTPTAAGEETWDADGGAREECLARQLQEVDMLRCILPGDVLLEGDGVSGCRVTLPVELPGRTGAVWRMEVGLPPGYPAHARPSGVRLSACDTPLYPPAGATATLESVLREEVQRRPAGAEQLYDLLLVAQDHAAASLDAAGERTSGTAAGGVLEAAATVADGEQSVGGRSEAHNNGTAHNGAAHNGTAHNGAAHNGTGQGHQASVTSVILLDHMRAQKQYCKLLERWAQDLGLGGGVVLQGHHRQVYLVLQGACGDVVQFGKRLRTQKVDVNAQGKPCRERKSTEILSRVPTAPGRANPSFSVVRVDRPSDLGAALASLGADTALMDLPP